MHLFAYIKNRRKYFTYSEIKLNCVFLHFLGDSFRLIETKGNEPTRSLSKILGGIVATIK